MVFDGVIERVYVDGQLNNSEAKMLLMHEGRPVYVGASEPGSEFLDGYLASLRVYDAALSETAVRQLAADAPSADVLVHLDSAKLDYGRLAAWENNGSLGGVFSGGNNAPVVEEVGGRIALKFASGQWMEFVPGAEVSPIPEFTLLATVANPTLEAGECAVEVEGAEAKRVGLLVEPPVGGWQQVAVVYRGERGVLYTNGTASARSMPLAPGQLKSIRLGGQQPFIGRLSKSPILPSGAVGRGDFPATSRLEERVAAAHSKSGGVCAEARCAERHGRRDDRHARQVGARERRIPVH